MKQTVGHLIDEGRKLWSIAPDATVFDALEALANHEIGAIVVVEDGALIGIVSERDYARKVELVDRASRQTSVRQIMTPDPKTVAKDATVDECMALMTEGRFRHLPVMDGDDLVGVVSMVDVVRAIVANQASLIGDLERYITG